MADNNKGNNNNNDDEYDQYFPSQTGPDTDTIHDQISQASQQVLVLHIRKMFHEFCDSLTTNPTSAQTV